ncbi:MAG: HAD-IA family hydrolase [Xanthomonadaceae bacterium]|nr:HAD-IA family hydrolase [Xanthomonadaceae bacterium]
MNLSIRAITFDLDDTLWPFAPISERLEQVLHDWMREHSPYTAERFPIAAMRALRDRVHIENPHLHHDLSRLRRITLERALYESGGDPALAEPAFEAFYAARSQVEYYPDTIVALRRISAKRPIAAVSNGNADLARIGLASLFAFQLGAREHGASKPEPSIFHAACARLDLPCAQVLHVGDHPEMDVAGAVRAGLRSCWLNREAQDWERSDVHPDLTFPHLIALADWLDAHPLSQESDIS